MKPAIDGGQLAFGFFGADNWNEQRRRRCQRQQSLSRLEHRRKVSRSRRDIAVPEQAGEKRDRFIFRIGCDHELTFALFFEPFFEGSAVSNDRRLKYRGCDVRFARRSPTLPEMIERLKIR